MSKLTDKVTDAARRAVEGAENKVFVAEGKRSLKARVATVKKVTRKAAKAGTIAGILVAAAVVTRETRKRRKLSS